MSGDNLKDVVIGMVGWKRIWWEKDNERNYNGRGNKDSNVCVKWIIRKFGWGGGLYEMVIDWIWRVCMSERVP